MLHYSWNHCS